MVELWLALFALLKAAVAAPKPPVQTQTQKAVMAEQAAKARVASEAATRQVISIFDSPTFRAGLRQCCSTVAGLPSEELLQRFRAEVRASELAHAVWSESIPVVGQYNWFLNAWQGPMAANKTVSPSYNLAEENIFGCPPFANKSRPTWDEAADRFIYVAHNLRQIDTGSPPNFGDVTAVFRQSCVQDMVLIGAVDTGLFELICNQSAYPDVAPPLIKFGCDHWKRPVVGTFQHFDHTILANLGVWSSALQTTLDAVAIGLFNRGPFAGEYLGLPKITLHPEVQNVMMFYEANILGNPRLPEGVSFLIGNFYSLFGTDSGRDLQHLADKFSWPLVWALGQQMPKSGSPHHMLMLDPRLQLYDGNQRILDPEAQGSRALNATVSPQAQAAFERVWVEVAGRRTIPLPITVDKWAQWWSTLVGSQARLAPLTAEAGCDRDLCIGTMAVSGDCVCLNTQAIAAVRDLYVPVPDLYMASWSLRKELWSQVAPLSAAAVSAALVVGLLVLARRQRRRAFEPTLLACSASCGPSGDTSDQDAQVSRGAGDRLHGRHICSP